MKSVSEFIGAIIMLYIVGMVTYGGIKEGHAIQTILILGSAILIIYLFSVREDSRAKMEQQKLEKEERKKFDKLLEIFKYKAYAFAFNNERISKIIYDIEEGGEYLTEYDENVKSQIDLIVKQHINFPNYNFEQFFPKIQDSILELPKQPKKKYVGF